MVKLAGKVAVITGSTSGIGLGIAQTLAKGGTNIVLNGFGQPEEIESERLNIEKTYNVKALYHNADMSKPDQIQRMIKSTVDAFGSVDVFVNNAGTTSTCFSANC